MNAHAKIIDRESTIIVQVERLTRDYLMGNSIVRALKGVSLTIHEGEFVALMGASGSGKSTLMHLLGCLDNASSGYYFLEGREVGSLTESERARIRSTRLGIIFQNFFLLPAFNALDNVALPLLYQPHAADIQERAREVLEQVGLAERAGHRPNELSGGERQRVAIARALITRPAILLADEPTGNLDSATGAEVMAILMDLWRCGLTILLVTHDPLIAAYAPRQLVMRDGQIISEECHEPEA